MRDQNGATSFYSAGIDLTVKHGLYMTGGWRQLFVTSAEQQYFFINFDYEYYFLKIGTA